MYVVIACLVFLILATDAYICMKPPRKAPPQLPPEDEEMDLLYGDPRKWTE